MTKETPLTRMLEYVSEQANFDTFYSIQYYPRRGELTLQGELSIPAVRVANEFGVNLEYKRDSGNMVGYNEDGSLRIVLTE
jgi:hypothetical protein